jgi:hypothetical protein
MMRRAEPGIRAPGPALTTSTIVGRWHVMAALNPSISPDESEDPIVFPPDPYSDDPWSWAFVLFRHIPGFPGYGVDTDGNVWTCLRSARSRWRTLTKESGRGGYQSVVLRVSGRVIRRRVHRLVLEAFVGPRPPGLECCHYPDHTSSNNRLRNLRWDTHRENMQDSVADGRVVSNWPKGQRHHCAKLNPTLAAELLALRDQGFGVRAIARRLSLDPCTVSRFLRGKVRADLFRELGSLSFLRGQETSTRIILEDIPKEDH